MQICNCKKCGYDWASRKLTLPDRCAKCHAKQWWREKRVPKIKSAKQNVGRPIKYPVGLLSIGQQMTMEWSRNVLSQKQSIEAYARRHGTAYELKSTMAGLVVRRLL